MIGFYLGTTLGLCAAGGTLALRWRQPGLVWVCGLLLNAAGALVWWSWQPHGLESLLPVLAIWLAISSATWTWLDVVYPGGVPHYGPARRPLVFAHAAVLAGLALTGLVAAWGLVRGLLAGPPLVLHRLDWLALIATGAALVSCLWDRAARFPLAGLYAGGLTAVGMGQIQRGLASAPFLLWGGVCDLAGFVLVAALLGWVLTQFRPVASRLRIPAAAQRWSGQWFRVLQAVLALAAASLVVWIATDVSFDELGQEQALLNLSGRLAACPAALMLLGTAILMAWQNRGPWRAGWQYAAMFAGMLFTSSIGWATMDAAAASPWLHRGVKLLISASMMTLLTGFGLGRVLPRHSDWIERGWRAMPAFGILALVLLTMIVGRRLW